MNLQILLHIKIFFIHKLFFCSFNKIDFFFFFRHVKTYQIPIYFFKGKNGFNSYNLEVY